MKQGTPLRIAVACIGAASLIIYFLGWVVSPALVLERKLYVRASPDEVFDFLRDFSNFPRFMSYVHDVRINDRGGLHWEVAGPGGIRLGWDADVDHLIQNQVIGWRSGKGSIIRNRGLIRLTEQRDGGTVISIELSYAPPAGAVGYAAIRILGFDPKTRIDGDLAVLRTLIEQRATRSA